MSRVLPAGVESCSIEFLAANAEIARRILGSCGVSETKCDALSSGRSATAGVTIDRRAEHGFGDGAVDFAFVDHEKSAYLPDLERIVERAGFTQGRSWSPTTFAFPALPSTAPTSRSRRARAGGPIEHDTHVQYQSLIKDLVLESEYLG